MAINIPTSEIVTPDLHADELGYVFFWHGHVLRGIFPNAVDSAMSYFSSGFLDEIIHLGYFPKTWVTEFENEQFGLIIEHEFISPTLYALEWNFSMLKDAAIMVLNIAQVAQRFGYNMIDCHKLNVMFKGNKPMFVDLGSFVKNKSGCTAWLPYESFKKSYFNILDVWSMGAPQVAKRLMAPGVEFDEIDYWRIKKPIYRKFGKVLSVRLNLRSMLHSFCLVDDVTLNKSFERQNKIKGCILKAVRNALKRFPFLSCQYKFNRLINKINRMSFDTLPIEDVQDMDYSYVVQKVQSYTEAKTALVIDCRDISFYQALIKHTSIKEIISVQEDQRESLREYEMMKMSNLPVVCTCFQMLNGIIITRHKTSEERLKSDIVILPNYEMSSGDFSEHNYDVLFETVKGYSKTNTVISNIQQSLIC